jgi:hypothetical protein
MSVIKSRTIRWMKHGEVRKANKNLVVKPERYRLLERPGSKGQESMLHEIGCFDSHVFWIKGGSTLNLQVL